MTADFGEIEQKNRPKDVMNCTLMLFFWHD